MRLTNEDVLVYILIGVGSIASLVFCYPELWGTWDNGGAFLLLPFVVAYAVHFVITLVKATALTLHNYRISKEDERNG